MNNVPSRLRWRCRRGMRELDLLLERFLDDQYPGLDPSMQERFEALLEIEDDTLFGWFYQGEEPEDAGTARLVAAIRRNFGV